MITKQQLKQIMPFAKMNDINVYIGPLNRAMENYQINTPVRIAAFLAQLAHESGSLRYRKEIASGEAYDTGSKAESLGNTPEKDGDGQRYKGRGPIQITGLANYKLLSKDTGIDFVGSPEKLEQPLYGSIAAGWFWNKKKLNKLADLNTSESFVKITKLINGGTNGLEDRIKHWNTAKKVLIK